MLNFHSITGLNVFGALLLLFTGKGLCCRRPPAPPDGFFLPSQLQYAEGANVTYFCDVEFRLSLNHESERFNYCLKGRWTSKKPPKCVQTSPCGQPGILENGLMTRDILENFVTYECESGFVLVGSSVRTCSGSNVWMPRNMPKCVTNLAYDKMVALTGVSDDSDSIVDDDFSSCHLSIRTRSFDVGIDLGQISVYTNVHISIEDGSWVNLQLKSSNESHNQKNRRLLKTFRIENVKSRLIFKTSTPSYPNRVERSKYVYLEPLNAEYNDFKICEMQVFNILEITACGTPDIPSNSFMEPKGSQRYIYECYEGYTQVGSFEIQCINGQWTPHPPTCKSNKHIDLTSNSSTMTYIAITIAVAIVTIVFAVLFTIFFTKRYYEKTRRLVHTQSQNEPIHPEYDCQESEQVQQPTYDSVYEEPIQKRYPRTFADSQHYETPILMQEEDSGQYVEILR